MDWSEEPLEVNVTHKDVDFLSSEAVNDLLDDHGEDGGVSGHPEKAQPSKAQQTQGQPAGGCGKGNQTNPKSKTKGNPKKDQRANANECKQGECPEALRLAKVVEKVLSRVDALEAEVQTLKSKMSAQEDGSKPISAEAKANADLAKKRADDGLKFVSKLSDELRQRWVTYFDNDLRPPLSAKEALDFIGACGWPAELLAKAGTASLNDVACGIARLYFCQGLTDGIDERYHFISWNTVTQNECLEYITWAAPCLGQWLESLTSVARDELLSSYKADHLDLKLALQPSARAQEVFRPTLKRKKRKSLVQVSKHNDLEGKSSIPTTDNTPVSEEQLQQETGAPATKRAKASREDNGPSYDDKYKHNRRSVTKTWRNQMIQQGHWKPADVDLLCKRLKDTLHHQGITNYPEYEEEVKLNAIQVVNTCREERDEAAYQAQVAKTAKTPAPVSKPGPSTSSLLPPNYDMVKSFASLDVRAKPPDNPTNIRGRGRGRGSGGTSYSSRGGQRGNHHHSRGSYHHSRGNHHLSRGRGGKSSN